MASEPHAHRGLVAVGCVVAPEDAGFHVRGECHENVVFPYTGGESAEFVQCIRRGVRPSVHPDDDRRPVVPSRNLPRDGRAVKRIRFGSELYSERAFRDIHR